MVMQILILVVTFLLGTPTSHDHDIHRGGNHKTELWIVNYSPYNAKNTDCFLTVSRTKRIGHPWRPLQIDMGCATNSGR